MKLLQLFLLVFPAVGATLLILEIIQVLKLTDAQRAILFLINGLFVCFFLLNLHKSRQKPDGDRTSGL